MATNKPPYKLTGKKSLGQSKKKWMGQEEVWYERGEGRKEGRKEGEKQRTQNFCQHF